MKSYNTVKKSHSTIGPSLFAGEKRYVSLNLFLQPPPHPFPPYSYVQTVFINHNCNTICGLIWYGLFTCWKLVWFCQFDLRLLDLQLHVPEVFHFTLSYYGNLASPLKLVSLSNVLELKSPQGARINLLYVIKILTETLILCHYPCE